MKKNITGQPVRGNDFFERPVLLHQLRQKIESGSSVLISAPRRVGKTSLMFRIADLGMEGYYLIYLITESVNSENEYYKYFLDKIFETGFLTPIQKLSKKTYNAIKDRVKRIEEIGTSIKFAPAGSRVYRDEFIDLLKTIDLEGKKIILLVDELSQTVENIIEDEGKSAAIHFLQGNRELRQDPDISQKIQFVIAGSIGLENIVSLLNAVNLVNDLDTLKVPPLSLAESHCLLQELSQNTPCDLGKSIRDYILDKIQWYIPFYIQLAVQVISDLCPPTEPGPGSPQRKITKKMVDDAFIRMLDLRNYFEHWQTRLRKAYKKEDYNFAKEFLNLVSTNENIEKKEILNLAHKFNLPDSYNDIVNSLVYDGYINNNDDPAVFRFNSPLLMMWWRKNVAF